METIVLKEELLPEMRDISEYFIFQQDSAPAHRAVRTKQLIFFQLKHQLSSRQHSGCVTPDLNPVDYKVWSVLQEQVYKVKVNDVDALHQRIQTVWDELDQRIISASLAL